MRLAFRVGFWPRGRIFACSFRHSSRRWWHGEQACRRQRASWQVHPTSHNAPTVEGQISHVTISDPRHSLYGQRLELVSLEAARGRDFIIVKVSNGRHRSIRRKQTDLMTPLREDLKPSAPMPRVNVGTLLTLMRHLRSTLALPMEEVIRDEETAHRVPCSVPSNTTISANGSATASLAETAGREEEATGQGCCRTAVADAASQRATKDDPSC